MWAGASLLLLLLAGLLLQARTRALVTLSEGFTASCFLCLDCLQGTLLALTLTDVVAQRWIVPIFLSLLGTLPAALYFWARFYRLLTVLHLQAPGMQGLSRLAEFGPTLMMLRLDPLRFHLRQRAHWFTAFRPECCEYYVVGLQAGLILSGIMQPEWLLLLMASLSSLLLFAYLLVLRPYRNTGLNVLVLLKFAFLGLASVFSILASRFYG